MDDRQDGRPRLAHRPDRWHRGDVDLVGVVYTGRRLDGVLTGRARRDGRNATDRIAGMIEGSRFNERIVLLGGIAVGGWNVVDIADADIVADLSTPEGRRDAVDAILAAAAFATSMLSACWQETTTASMRFGTCPRYSTDTWLLPSGRSQSSSPDRRASLSRWVKRCAKRIGVGISASVSSDA